MSIMPEQYAFVLHARPYRDNQQLVDLFTEAEGKVSALVFVGQSKRSIKKALLQPFLPLKVILKGNANLKHIHAIESCAKSYPLVRHSLFSAFYINELLIRLLTEHITCQDLFNQYQKTISALANQQDIAPQLRIFEAALLAELGVSFEFSPVFEHDVQWFCYVGEEGFIPIYDEQVMTKTEHNRYFNSEHLRAIANKQHQGIATLSVESEQTFKLLMRQVINNLLGNKPLNSRKLFIKNL
ncbi:DNA repair protein RecO [Colwellia sp. D2M02]|uniref:DNA repair protein RecO n=1 Tax=Colwellia sp. D2M02 TaxID=2841562 RepID=UPI0020908572|nr:DNA repair protein RecO [Colwellia sp. D2M02]